MTDRGDPSADVSSVRDAAMPATQAGDDAAQILDQRYRSYSGTRHGLAGAMRAVIVSSTRFTLGLGRPARHKFLPWLAVVIALVPAIVLVGWATVFDSDLISSQILPDYHEYYSWIQAALFFYCGIVVPEILVADRRNGMLPLYLSTPLRPWSYLASKAAAVVATLAVITVGPLLFLLVAYTIEGSGPDGPVDWAIVLVRILVAGVAIAATITAASLAISSLTDRRAFAVIGVILLLLGSNLVTSVLVEVAEVDPHLYGFNLGEIGAALKDRIFGVGPPSTLGESEGPPSTRISELSTLFVLAANAAWVIAGGAVVWWRYRRIVVSR
ncbi:ABC transporter permease [Candidatus Poriferisodalis sp.]|uniref:ABC transporter permease n=1 Tax=Candidatus Poriferisodalis sp. TaxID=3101277 RepID=UPI003B02050C